MNFHTIISPSGAVLEQPFLAQGSCLMKFLDKEKPLKLSHSSTKTGTYFLLALISVISAITS